MVLDLHLKDLTNQVEGSVLSRVVANLKENLDPVLINLNEKANELWGMNQQLEGRVQDLENVMRAVLEQLGSPCGAVPPAPRATPPVLAPQSQHPVAQAQQPQQSAPGAQAQPIRFHLEDLQIEMTPTREAVPWQSQAQPPAAAPPLLYALQSHTEAPYLDPRKKESWTQFEKQWPEWSKYQLYGAPPGVDGDIMKRDLLSPAYTPSSRTRSGRWCLSAPPSVFRRSTTTFSATSVSTTPTTGNRSSWR